MEPLPGKPKRFFWPRMAASFIDLVSITGLYILISWLLRQFVYIDHGLIFIWVFAIYYATFDMLLNGRTFGRNLVGLYLIRYYGTAPSVLNIVFREFFWKAFVGIYIPSYLIPATFSKQSFVIAIFFQLLVLFLSFVGMIIFRRPFWDWGSGTRLAQNSLKYKSLKISFGLFSLVMIISLFMLEFPLFEKGEQERFDSFPTYPNTKEVQVYTSYAREKGKDPVEYIFDLYKKYDIVVLSERIHPECTQYEFITRLIADSRFKDEVGNLFTECGSVSFQDTVNTIMHTNFANEDSLNVAIANLQRNSNGVWPMWSNTNLFDLFKAFNHINNNLPDTQQLNWYFTDLAVDWRTMSAEGYRRAYTNKDRDSLMAAHIITPFFKKISNERRHKALVIMNTRHAYAYKGSLHNSFTEEYRGTAAFLHEAFPGRVANVMIHTVSMKYAFIYVPIQNGKWDRALEFTNDSAIGFDFEGSPFGEDIFDGHFLYTNKIKYKDMFTGFIYYKPLKEHYIAESFPHQFDNFEDTILRRASFVDPDYVDAIKYEINYFKKHPTNPVFIERVGYTFMYNIFRLAVLPSLIILGWIVGLICFIRRRSSYPEGGKIFF